MSERAEITRYLRQWARDQRARGNFDRASTADELARAPSGATSTTAACQDRRRRRCRQRFAAPMRSRRLSWFAELRCRRWPQSLAVSVSARPAPKASPATPAPPVASEMARLQPRASMAMW